MAKAEGRASPLDCHGGRQAGYFGSELFPECERTRRNYLLQNRPASRADRGHGEQWRGRSYLSLAVSEGRGGQTDGQRETVGLTDLMRGTLSRVQHTVGPLCKCSSSPHDWLYNLERQTRVNTCAHAGYSPGLRKTRATRGAKGGGGPRGAPSGSPRLSHLEKTRGKFSWRICSGTYWKGSKKGARSVSKADLCFVFVRFFTFTKCVAGLELCEEKRSSFLLATE